MVYRSLSAKRTMPTVLEGNRNDASRADARAAISVIIANNEPRGGDGGGGVGGACG